MQPIYPLDDYAIKRWCVPYYLDFFNGHFLYPSAEANESMDRVQQVLSKITPEIVEDMLYHDYWAVFSTAGWYCGLKGWSDFEILIGRTLMRRHNICYVQGVCFALARFGSHYGANCLRGYLNAQLRGDYEISEHWAIGALAYLDQRLGTSHTEDYLFRLAVHNRKIASESNTLYRMAMEEEAVEVNVTATVAFLQTQIDSFTRLMNLYHKQFSE